MVDPKAIESRPTESGVAVWYFGGPSLAIRSRESLVYLDLFTGTPPIPDIHKAIPDVIDPEEIQWADLAISTHQDEDHCDRHSLSILHKNTSALFLGPVSCNVLYREWGFDLARTRLIAPHESFAKAGVTIHALPSSDVFDPDAVCYLLEIGGVTIFDGGDTLHFPEMAEIGRQWDIDIAMLSYARSPAGKVYYMDEAAVFEATKDLGAQLTVLKHYDLWEEFAVDPAPLVESLLARGHNVRLCGLGECFQYPGGATDRRVGDSSRDA